MPHFTVSFTQGGPIIDLIVTASGARIQALELAGLPLPTPQAVRGLIDTGASHTCMDPSVFEALGLQPTGSILMHTPSTGDIPQAADTYDVGMVIPNNLQAALVLHHVQVSASLLAHVQGFHAVIGRDILAQCILVYNGSVGSLSFSY